MTDDEYQVEIRKEYLGVARLANGKAIWEAVAAKTNADKADIELQIAKDSAEAVKRRWQNENRPSITLRAVIGVRERPEGGKVYTATVGHLTVEGDTPEVAFDNLDHIWIHG